MGGLDRRIGKRQRHHARGHLRTERRDARGPRLVVQEAVDAFLHEPFLPAPDAGLRDLPVRRMILLVPTPSALKRMIAARQACFCEALRSLVIASSRPRTDRVIAMEIPVRMRQTRTATETEESQSGLFCQAKTTRRLLPLVKVRLFTKPPYVAGPHPWADKFVPRHLSDGFGQFPFVYGDPLANQFDGSFLIGFVCKKIPHDSRVSLGIESRDPDVPSCWHSHAPQLSSVNDLPYTN